jgi:hypothetical protein
MAGALPWPAFWLRNPVAANPGNGHLISGIADARGKGFACGSDIVPAQHLEAADR